MSEARPVILSLAPSRRFAAVIVGVHAAAAVSFLTAMTAWPAGLLAALMLALGCFSAWDRALLRGGRSPREIELRPSGEAFVRLGDGRTAALSPIQGAGVTRFWVALGAALPSRRGILVTAGMLGEENFRRLRLWALWGKVPGVAPGQLPA